MPNRVKELESAVAQLQATVDGLQEELVDANERIRALERDLAEEREEPTEKEDSSPVPFAVLESPPENNGGTDEDEEPSTAEDIIVA